MYTETINKCAANAARINRFERTDKLGFWLSSAMAGAYVGLGIILIFTSAIWWIPPSGRW